MKSNILTQRNALLILFAVFMILRLFVNEPAVLLVADNLKFMEAAKNFPNHALYNGQMYLLHPPLYPYAIYFFTLIFQSDFVAALMISLISAALTFWVLYRFVHLLTNNFLISYITVFFYTLSDSLIVTANIALREAFVILLMLSTLYFFALYLKQKNTLSLVGSALCGAILALTSDHVVFIFPALGLTYLFFSKLNVPKLKFPHLVQAIILVLVIGGAYSAWTFTKYSIYSDAEYYPNGFEGTPIKIDSVGFLQSVSPQFFEDYYGPQFNDNYWISLAKRLAFNFGYMINMEPTSIPRGLNFTSATYLLEPYHIIYMILIYIPLALIFVYASILIVLRSLKKKTLYDNTPLYMLVLFILFAFPLTQQFASPRYVLFSYLFVFFILAFGITQLINQRKIQFDVRKTQVIFISVLGIISILWVFTHPYIVLFNDSELSAKNTAEYIRNNIDPSANIIVQPGYTVKLIYQTENDIIGLHGKPESLAPIIEHYDIDYIVVGRYYTYTQYQLSKETSEYVQNSPELFTLVKTVHEDYSGFRAPESDSDKDEIFIYKINRE